MNLETLKQQIVATVDASQDETLLKNVMTMLSQHTFNSIETSINDAELTRFCMEASEKSLSEAWENEDDEYWNSFLKT